MLLEVSGPCGTVSNTLRPKRLPIHIGSAGERARPPVQSFFVLGQMNRTEVTEPKLEDELWVRGGGWVVGWQLFAFIVKHAARAMPRRSRTRSIALNDFSPPVCIIATSPVVCATRGERNSKMC
jgi:hypothetical protein